LYLQTKRPAQAMVTPLEPLSVQEKPLDLVSPSALALVMPSETELASLLLPDLDQVLANLDMPF
jgi:hypothetical protein